MYGLSTFYIDTGSCGCKNRAVITFTDTKGSRFVVSEQFNRGLNIENTVAVLRKLADNLEAKKALEV